MLHTGDKYEFRARTARNRELRQLVMILTQSLFRSQPSSDGGRSTVYRAADNHNARANVTDRAA